MFYGYRITARAASQARQPAGSGKRAETAARQKWHRRQPARWEAGSRFIATATMPMPPLLRSATPLFANLAQMAQQNFAFCSRHMANIDTTELRLSLFEWPRACA